MALVMPMRRLTCVYLLCAIVGCNRGAGEQSIRGALPTTEAECYEFVLRHATSPEHGAFLLRTCESLLDARKKELQEDASPAVVLGGATGRASVLAGTFNANVYNNTGYDLTELVFEIRLFETQEKKEKYEESTSNKEKSESVEPDEIRRIRIKQDHPNLTARHYSAEIASPYKFFVWTLVGGRGIPDPNAKSIWDEIIENLKQGKTKPDSQSML